MSRDIVAAHLRACIFSSRDNLAPPHVRLWGVQRETGGLPEGPVNLDFGEA